jgi:hypothetical protein|tara:strand:+ start:98 stop:349 length:252 start_codon:yes stop_codon:yes gene_type:complete
MTDMSDTRRVIHESLTQLVIRKRRRKITMFNKITHVFRHGTISTGFEAYLNRVRQETGQFGPTIDEARSDYKRMASQRYGNMS